MIFSITTASIACSLGISEALKASSVPYDPCKRASGFQPVPRFGSESPCISTRSCITRDEALETPICLRLLAPLIVPVTRSTLCSRWVSILPTPCAEARAEVELCRKGMSSHAIHDGESVARDAMWLHSKWSDVAIAICFRVDTCLTISRPRSRTLVEVKVCKVQAARA